MMYKIIDEHGGTIKIASQAGQGTAASIIRQDESLFFASDPCPGLGKFANQIVIAPV